MSDLIITINLQVNDVDCRLTKEEAEEASKQAYKAARKALLQFTPYDINAYDFKIEH